MARFYAEKCTDEQIGIDCWFDGVDPKYQPKAGLGSVEELLDIESFEGITFTSAQKKLDNVPLYAEMFDKDGNFALRTTKCSEILLKCGNGGYRLVNLT